MDQAPRTLAYQVVLAPDGHGLEWVELTEKGEIRYHKEPKVGFLKRLLVKILGWLPIDSML